MTKSDLIAKFADRYPRLLGKDAEAAVNAVLDAIAMTMVKGERTEIRGFGSFTIKHRPSPTSRNPRTGVTVAVPEKYAPHFKAGRELKERVDR